MLNLPPPDSFQNRHGSQEARCNIRDLSKGLSMAGAPETIQGGDWDCRKSHSSCRRTRAACCKPGSGVQGQQAHWADTRGQSHTSSQNSGDFHGIIESGNPKPCVPKSLCGQHALVRNRFWYHKLTDGNGTVTSGCLI